MKFQTLFYIIGILFLFAAIAYFAYEYLFNLSRMAKTIILICLIVLFFGLGSFMEERDI